MKDSKSYCKECKKHVVTCMCSKGSKNKVTFEGSACIAIVDELTKNGNVYTKECLINMATEHPDKYEFKEGKLYLKG